MSEVVVDKDMAGTMAERVGSAMAFEVEGAGRLISEPLLLLWLLAWLLREEEAVEVTILEVMEASVAA